VTAPLVGWPTVSRLPGFIVPACVALAFVLRPWRWTSDTWQAVERYQPSQRFVVRFAAVTALLLMWIVWTRFQSGDINAIDFTVYFDRPCFQTVAGKPLFVETADLPGMSWQSQLRVHAFWIMFAACAPYSLYPSPAWLLVLAVVAVVLGATHTLRLVGTVTGSGVLGVAAALAFVLNANTARALMYGFHPEILYAWFVPWALDAGVRNHRWSFLAAVVACVLVKEDAVLLLFAVSTCLPLVRGARMRMVDRTVYLVLPTLLALVNLAVYYGAVLPVLAPDGRPTYADFWGNYGATPVQALTGMARQPWRVLVETLGSGFLTQVLPPFLFLPLIGWRWLVGILPIIFLYGASQNDQLRSFGIYYAIVLVPFLTAGAAVGARSLASSLRRLRRPDLCAAVVLSAGALLVFGTRAGYVLRPWSEDVSALPAVLASLKQERLILVGSDLYPHAGYAANTQLLTPDTLQARDSAGAAVVLTTHRDSYPFTEQALQEIRRLPTMAEGSGTLLVLRNKLPEGQTRVD
jgi:uncharacterized membrane protein